MDSSEGLAAVSVSVAGSLWYAAGGGGADGTAVSTLPAMAVDLACVLCAAGCCRCQCPGEMAAGVCSGRACGSGSVDLGECGAERIPVGVAAAAGVCVFTDVRNGDPEGMPG